MASFLQFLKEHEPIATWILAIGGVISILLVACQIYKTKKQIRVSFSYQLHKDGREIRKSIDEDVAEFIKSKSALSEVPEDMRGQVKSKVRELMMYYASAYNQYYFGNIDESDWKALEAEFITFLEFPLVRKYWDKKIAQNESWNEGFRKRGQKLLTQKGGS